MFRGTGCWQVDQELTSSWDIKVRVLQNVDVDVDVESGTEARGLSPVAYVSF